MKYVLFVVLIGSVVGPELYQPAGAVEVNPNVASAGELYRKNCASCHGKDGRAKTFKAKFNKARDISDATWHESVSDERVFNSIMNGRGKKMPAYSKKLSVQEIESLVSFVRSLRR
ncbi:MAG TPA: cytochrome c [Pyrinomonadaceae bacterium]|nr:cytochrome c [Pyrinomonadaceae bacterium]